VLVTQTIEDQDNAVHAGIQTIDRVVAQNTSSRNCRICICIYSSIGFASATTEATSPRGRGPTRSTCIIHQYLVARYIENLEIFSLSRRHHHHRCRLSTEHCRRDRTMFIPASSLSSYVQHQDILPIHVVLISLRQSSYHT
jgi:hypothetical protein